jgi:hypothetical protein
VKKTNRLAILNGFGRSLGDGIIGLQALFAADFPAVVLFRHPACSPLTQQLYALAADFAEIVDLPGTLAGSPPEPLPVGFADAFAQMIDIRDFALDPSFRGVAMIDYFLTKLGLNPESVPKPLRRNTWLAPRVELHPPTGLPARYVLFAPSASMAQRDIPTLSQLCMLRILVDGQPLPVITQGPVPAELAKRVFAAPDCTSINQLCALVAGAARIVSTDTAILHLADAFRVPCLSFFTTHEPQWRVRDYPNAVPVKLPVDGLPPALEFIRSADDLAAIARGWDEGAALVDTALTQFLRQ